MERKKLLLISVSLGFFLVVVIGASIMVFSPRNNYPAIVSTYDGQEKTTAKSATPVSPAQPEAGDSDFTAVDSGDDAVTPVPSASTDANATLADSSETQTEGEKVPGSSATTDAPKASLEATAAGSSGNKTDADKKTAPVPVPITVTTTRNGTRVAAAPQPAGTTQAPTPIVINVLPAPAGSAGTATMNESPVNVVNVVPRQAAPTRAKRKVSNAERAAIVRAEQEERAARYNATKGRAVVASRQPERTDEPATVGSYTEKPTPKAANNTRKDFWVQAGAFSQKRNADSARNSLKERGITKSKIVPSGALYRLRIGPYADKEEATYWLGLIREIKGFEKSQVWESVSL